MIALVTITEFVPTVKIEKIPKVHFLFPRILKTITIQALLGY
jgi:hypothetical protein